MILPVANQPGLDVRRGGIHHVGDVVTVVLAGLKVKPARNPLPPDLERGAVEQRGAAALSCGLGI